MQDKDLINITVVVAGRPFPLKVRAVDETTIRQIAKSVNDKINHFQLTYKNKDKYDCLCMTALTFAVELQRARLEYEVDSTVQSRLSNLDALLDSLLAS